MSKIGREYLNRHKADLPLPLISRVSSRVSDLLHLDIKASRVYALGVKGRQQQILLEQEFKQPPIMIQ
jgi:hypothetical protein